MQERVSDRTGRAEAAASKAVTETQIHLRQFAEDRETLLPETKRWKWNRSQPPPSHQSLCCRLQGLGFPQSSSSRTQLMCLPLGSHFGCPTLELEPSRLLPPLAAALRSAHPPSLPPARAPLGCSSGRWGSGPSGAWLTGPFLFNTNWVWATRWAGSRLCPLTPSCLWSDGLMGD